MLEVQIGEGPGRLIGVEPRAFSASRLGGEAAGSLCLFPRALSSARGPCLGSHRRLRSDLAAIPVRLVRCTVLDLPPM